MEQASEVLVESRPFAPPEDSESGDTHLSVVVGSWAIAGAAVGTLVGATLQLTGAAPSVLPWALGTTGALALAGMGAWALERRLAARRPAVADGRGRLSRPLGLWVLGIPLVVLVLALLGLVVIATVRAGSPVPGLLFLGAALGLAWFGRPLVASQLLTRAVQAMELGHLDEAHRRLAALAGSAWVSGGVRAQAQLNLGLLALQGGDLDAAARWYSQPGRGAARAFAQTGLALVSALQGHCEGAEAALRRAQATGAGRAIQGEVDAVRLLVVLRRDGVAEALELGERLHGAGSGALFLGLLAAIRHAGGDELGAEVLLVPEVTERLRHAGFAEVVPEIGQVLRALS